MSPAKRQSPYPPWTRHVAAAAALGLLLGFIGPFGSTPALELRTRYFFWLGLALFGYACVLASSRLVHSAPAIAGRAAAVRLLLTAALSAVPQTLAATWALSLVQTGRAFSPGELPALFAAVLVVQLAIALVAAAVDARSGRPQLEAATSQAPPPLLASLPAHLGGDLVALEAEDHYLRVHTSAGSHLVLSRLSDAVAQLHRFAGLQVHRSWWVADDAVVGVDSKGGRTVVRLRNGLAAPVSRTYLQAVRTRAWPTA